MINNINVVNKKAEVRYIRPIIKKAWERNDYTEYFKTNRNRVKA